MSLAFGHRKHPWWARAGLFSWGCATGSSKVPFWDLCPTLPLNLTDVTPFLMLPESMRHILSSCQNPFTPLAGTFTQNLRRLKPYDCSLSLVWPTSHAQETTAFLTLKNSGSVSKPTLHLESKSPLPHPLPHGGRSQVPVTKHDSGTIFCISLLQRVAFNVLLKHLYPSPEG